MEFVFKCLRCSDCCVFVNPEDYPRVFPWEKRFLEKKAGDLGLRLSFKPDLVYYDPFREKYVVLLYRWVIGGRCPFNRGSRCIIHGEHPYACRMYPLIISYGDRTLRLGLQCNWVKRYFDRIREGISPDKVFPNEFSYAVKAFTYISLMIEEAKRYGWRQVNVDEVGDDAELVDYDVYVEGGVSES